MPVTGFAMDVVESEDGQTVVALLTLQSGDLAFEFAINQDGANAMVGSLQPFLDMIQSGAAGRTDPRLPLTGKRHMFLICSQCRNRADARSRVDALGRR
jgi:hypothetical protein